MVRIDYDLLAASVRREPADFASWLDRIDEPIFQDYTLSDVGRILKKYVKYEYMEALKEISLHSGETERDDVEEIRALALQEHIRRKALMDVDEAKEYERQKNDILSIKIGDKFFKK